MEVNSAVGRAAGIPPEDLAALADYARHQAFSAPEKAALAYAESMATANTVPAELFALIEQYFSQDEIVELTAIIAWEICAAKFNRALEIEGQGICPLPGAKQL